MAIQVRRGNKTKFDARKLLPGEWAVALDTKEIYLCFAAGDVRRMATYEEMEENINAATEDIQAAFTAEVREAIRSATQAASNAAQATSAANAAAASANEAAEEARQYILGDVSSKTVSFTQAASRAEILSGESLATIMGKIKKWFADLASVAFTGSYNSLSNRPSLGTAAARNVANNLTTTTTTYVLDARQGKALGDRLTTAEASIAVAETSITTVDNKLERYSPLRTQSVLYSSQFYADVVNTVKYTSIPGLSAYKMVLMHCEVGDAYSGALVFTPQEIQQKVGAISAANYFGRASFYCDFTNNRIGVQVHNKPDGWGISAFKITKVYGILL